MHKGTRRLWGSYGTAPQASGLPVDGITGTSPLASMAVALYPHSDQEALLDPRIATRQSPGIECP